MPSFEPVIGLEVHAELMTQSKMFCGCEVVDSISSPPNSAVCEICTGIPGTLPVINKRAIEFAIRVGLALHCEIAPISVFARKNYFYPDLPKGFQTSQFELPLASKGWLTIESGGMEKKIRVTRVHLEEDTGKLTHREERSLVDFNRSGVPLLEIVTEPDLHSMEDVKSYATGLRSLLRYLRVNTGELEKGVIRFEANISMRPAGSQELGKRTEIKNLNSFRSMLRALEFEIDRQTAILSVGGLVRQETMGWDEDRLETFSQRSKEDSHDYRYFPEPDLPPLHVAAEWISEIQSALPETPAARRRRLISDLGIKPYTASILTAERDVADFFEAALEYSPGIDPQKIANWVSGEFFGLLNEAAMDINKSLVSPELLAELVVLIDKGEINLPSGKKVLAEMFTSGDSPQKIIERLDLTQVSNLDIIDELIAAVLDEHSEQVRQYLDGKESLQKWLFGQVMRAAKGRASPKIAQERMNDRLAELAQRHNGIE
jgi:aspartyl-tRNA(Asn)/glutamyl-tRNA(Gln) amidotransferase subunit B